VQALLAYAVLSWFPYMLVTLGLTASEGGLMFGLMFGIGGIGAAGLGKLADIHGIVWVYHFTSYLPLLGLATAFLPKTRPH
ncbi:MAG: MFS transporter, partial [Stenotrophomonas sp.]